MQNSKPVTILLVDDDHVDVMGVKRSFNQFNFKNPIVVALDGCDALEKLRDGKTVSRPYLVLLDLNMPRMNGIEFLTAARKDPELSDSVVFVLTTSNAGEDKEKAYAHNVAGYIVKEGGRERFINVVGLLEQYSKVVELP